MFLETRITTDEMSDKVQLNLQVPKGIAQKVRSDARRSGKTLDDVGTIIFADFFKAWTRLERAKFYEHAANKVSGRKVAA